MELKLIFWVLVQFPSVCLLLFCKPTLSYVSPISVCLSVTGICDTWNKLDWMTTDSLKSYNFIEMDWTERKDTFDIFSFIPECYKTNSTFPNSYWISFITINFEMKRWIKTWKMICMLHICKSKIVERVEKIQIIGKSLHCSGSGCWQWSWLSPGSHTCHGNRQDSSGPLMYQHPSNT